MKLPQNEGETNPDPAEPDPTGNETPLERRGDTLTAQPPENGSRTDADDFSEFLWMEHEDDYDREVLKELHEEETMNYYCDLFEEAQANGPLPRSFQLIAPPLDPTLEIRHDLDGVTDRFSRINFGSRLNPDAPEFVPRFSSPNHHQSPASDGRLEEKLPAELTSRANHSSSQDPNKEPSA